MKVFALIDPDPFTRSRVVPQGTPGAEEFESEEAYKAWVDAQPPLATAEPPRWRVSKDTLVGRIPTEALPSVMSALAQQSPEQQFLFLQSAWFWSDNANLRGLAEALDLDADALLAPDPFLS